MQGTLDRHQALSLYKSDNYEDESTDIIIGKLCRIWESFWKQAQIKFHFHRSFIATKTVFEMF